jgi:hypothetical protein
VIVVLVMAALVACSVVLTAAGGLRIRRYSRSHWTGQLALAGRGLYVSRTPDGAWWRFRLRPCRRRCEDRSGWGEPPPDSGVREPRRPLAPAPIHGAIGLEPPRGRA